MKVKNLSTLNVLEIRGKIGIGEIGGDIADFLDTNKNSNFVVVTAFNENKSFEVNDKKNTELYRTLKVEKGLSKLAHLITAHYEVCSDKNCQESYADFWIIFPQTSIDDLEKELQELLKKYKQNSYIVKENDKIIIKDNDGNILDTIKGELNKENFEQAIISKLESDNNKINLKGIYVIKPKDNISSKRLFALMGVR